MNGRKLTQGQKKLLRTQEGVKNADDLPYDIWEQLKEMHDTEVLWQETNSFLYDQFMKG